MEETYQKRKAFRSGGSIAITIPEEVVNEYEIKEGDELRIAIDKGWIMFKKVE
jgi:antitoxin component of MazEF toxin-antitoxin module